ncbi:hypothetical protein PFISCL1PPCAC_11979, partial [Pristionchus fissidentatus]
ADFLKQIFSYFGADGVEEKEVPMRPVCIRGALKYAVYSELLKNYPCRFSFGLETTSSRPRHGEISGCRYHFTTEEDMLEGIRTNQYVEYYKKHNDMYGLTINSVNEILDQGRHCILDVSHDRSIRQLKSIANIDPIVIFIDSPSAEQIMQFDDDVMCEASAHSLFRTGEHEKITFDYLITHTISDASSLEDIVEKVVAICKEESKRSKV